MDHFNYQGDALFAEQCDLRQIAKQYGTPCYVYSRATLERHFRIYSDAFADQDHLICYAVKANSNLAVLQILAQLGAGFDIVSGGELQRVLAAGADPAKVVFSGVAKTTAELNQSLRAGIRSINIESEAELERVAEVAAELGVAAPIALRVNPNVDAKTHPYIATGLRDNKFGIDIGQAPRIYARAQRFSQLQIKGVACHIGSQLTEIEPFTTALWHLLQLAGELRQQGMAITEIDIGGGLGIPFHDRSVDPPLPQEYAKALCAVLGDADYKLLLEPGRSIVGNAGILLTQVQLIKQTQNKNFAIVDAGMNDLLRPALYNAWQDIIPVQRLNIAPQDYDVVGPVCESGDFLGKKRNLAIDSDSLLAVRSAGAYGFVMSSNYNTRPRAAEIMVDGSHTHLIRRRENVQELLALESLLQEGVGST